MERICFQVEQDIPQPEQFQAPLPPSKQKDIIVRDYDPKKGPQKKGADQWLISPLTGEKIPMNKMDEHVRCVFFILFWHRQVLALFTLRSTICEKNTDE